MSLALPPPSLPRELWTVDLHVTDADVADVIDAARYTPELGAWRGRAHRPIRRPSSSEWHRRDLVVIDIDACRPDGSVHRGLATKGHPHLMGDGPAELDVALVGRSTGDVFEVDVWSDKYSWVHCVVAVHEVSAVFPARVTAGWVRRAAAHMKLPDRVGSEAELREAIRRSIRRERAAAAIAAISGGELVEVVDAGRPVGWFELEEAAK